MRWSPPAEWCWQQSGTWLSLGWMAFTIRVSGFASKEQRGIGNGTRWTNGMVQNGEALTLPVKNKNGSVAQNVILISQLFIGVFTCIYSHTWTVNYDWCVELKILTCICIGHYPDICWLHWKPQNIGLCPHNGIIWYLCRPFNQK